MLTGVADISICPGTSQKLDNCGATALKELKQKGDQTKTFLIISI